jgi:hypothetical protein
MALHYATPDEAKAVYGHFAKFKELFPHVRSDYIGRMCETRQCIYDSGVVITFAQYKVRQTLGTIVIPARDFMLHQILNSGQFNGAGGRVFEQFVEEIVRPYAVYLSVRSANDVARRFYEKHGMSVVGSISWLNGTLPGVIYRR